MDPPPSRDRGGRALRRVGPPPRRSPRKISWTHRAITTQYEPGNPLKVETRVRVPLGLPGCRRSEAPFAIQQAHRSSASKSPPMPRSIIAALALTVIVLANGCGGGGSKHSETLIKSTTTMSSAKPNLGKFCAAMATLGRGYAGQSPDAALRDAAANAPIELRHDITQFITNGKAVSAAAAAARATASSFDSSTFMSRLSPEQQQFVRDLAAASKGSPPSGYIGRVFAYLGDHCDNSSSSSLRSVGPAIN